MLGISVDQSALKAMLISSTEYDYVLYVDRYVCLIRLKRIRTESKVYSIKFEVTSLLRLGYTIISFVIYII